MFEKVKKFFNEKDKFAKYNHIEMIKVEEKFAIAQLNICQDSLNGMDNVQGGAIMTLADFAFAGAANSIGKATVSMSFSSNFIRPGTGKKLIARAEIIHDGRKTIVGEVTVINEDEKIVALITITGFVVPPPPGYMENI